MTILVIANLALVAFSSEDQTPNEAKPETGNPLFSSYEIDSEIKQVVYCGSAEVTEKVIVLTQSGSVLTSSNSGFNWDVMDELLTKTGKVKLDDPKTEEIGHIKKIVQSDIEKHTLFFVGTNNINWVSSDCGVTVSAFNQGRPIDDLYFHPDDPKWIIATAYTLEDESEVKYKELFYSTNGGFSWKFLTDFVKQVSWGSVNYDHIEYGVPKARVIVTRHSEANPENETSESQKRLDLVFSDDFFMTPVVSLTDVEQFIIAGNSVYVSKVEYKDKELSSKIKEDGKEHKTETKQRNLVLMYASTKHFTYQFSPVKFNADPDLAHNHYSFITIDSNQTIVLNVNHHTPEGVVGDLYISNKYSEYFGHSLQHNVKQEPNGELDFIHVAGMEGVFISNVVEHVPDRTSNVHVKEQKRLFQKNLENYHSSKEDFQIVSKISFNYGSSWHKLTAPVTDSEGKPYPTCEKKSEIKLSCNLHLWGMTSGKHEIISKRKAIGLILANGNVGPHLSHRIYTQNSQNNNASEEVNLFLSRDGGLTWRELRKGEHTFNIGDHGGIFIIAKKNESTNTILYSTDEGETFEEVKITINPITIHKIEVVDDSVNFVIVGTDNTNNAGVVIALDFQKVFLKQCQSPEMPDHHYSDYEKWTPHDLSNGVIGHECLMGKKNTYVRRKPFRKCYNGLKYDLRVLSQTCTCKETDFQCDLGYQKDGHMSPCVKIFDHPEVNKPDSTGCVEVISRGYKKIPGNKCEGGTDLGPVHRSCAESAVNSQLIYSITTIVVCAVIFMGFSYIGRFLKLETNRSRRTLPPIESGYKNLEMKNVDLNESRARLHKKKGSKSKETIYHSDSGSD